MPRAPRAATVDRPAAERLWDLLARPFSSLRAAESLLGLTPVAARLMGGVILASSPEADRLVDELPLIVRSLAIATTNRNERMHGEVRGPIVWSETMAARASSAGDPQLYVCAASSRAYDTSENRVLVAALRSLITATRLVDREGLRRRNTELARHIRYNAGLAVRFADHRALAGITHAPNQRDLGRTRAGKRRATYASAIALLGRASQPITAAHIAALSDPRTAAQHAAIVEAVGLLRARGHAVPPLRATNGILRGGPLEYVHDGARRRTDAPPGLRIGNLVVDVALDTSGAAVPGDTALERLSSRAGGRPCAVLIGPGDLEWALDQAGQFPRH